MQDFYDIASAGQNMDVPLTQAHLLQLARMCDVNSGTRVLDLACGKGEMLVQWAREFDLQGTGVDENEAAIDVAQHRAGELEVWSQVHFVVAEVLEYPQAFHQYNIVSLLSATVTGVSLVEMITLMREALKTEAGGLLLVGDMFWQKEPTPEVCQALGVERDWLHTMSSLLAQFNAAGVELMDMLIPSTADWDAYYTQQWRGCLAWLRDNPEHEDAPALREWLHRNRQNYLNYERDFLGWGVFVLSVPGQPKPVEKQADTDADDEEKFDWQKNDNGRQG